MINFIICTENKELTRKVLTMLEQVMWKDHYQVHTFSRFKDDLLLLGKNKWNQNVYLFDLQCTTMNIIQVGSKIYRENPDVFFLFVTETLELGLPLLSCGYPFYSCLTMDHHFEPCLEKKLVEIKKQLGRTNSLVFCDKSCNYHILFHDILYITTDTVARKTVIVTQYGKIKTSIPFYSLKELLGEQFVQTHRACFANICRIRKIDYQKRTIEFDNDEEIDLLSTRAARHIKESAVPNTPKVVDF